MILYCTLLTFYETDNYVSKTRYIIWQRETSLHLCGFNLIFLRHWIWPESCSRMLPLYVIFCSLNRKAICVWCNVLESEPNSAVRQSMKTDRQPTETDNVTGRSRPLPTHLGPADQLEASQVRESVRSEAAINPIRTTNKPTAWRILDRNCNLATSSQVVRQHKVEFSPLWAVMVRPVAC